MSEFRELAEKTVVELFDMVKEKVVEIHSLKAQLNNIEACYIEKKKQVEDQQKRIDKALSITGNYCDEDDAVLLIYVLEKALRGAND